MSIRKFALPATAIALAGGVIAGLAITASANSRAASTAHGGSHSSAVANVEPSAASATGKAEFFVAVLNGMNEVPVVGGPAVGDPDGTALALVRLQGDEVSFALRWKNIAAPAAGHIHQAVAGQNGAIKVPFFGSALPGSANATTGTVKADQTLIQQISANPAGFYVNLHTAEFPGGAVRAQLHKLPGAVDLNGVLRGGPLASLNDGQQEVPGAAPSGDPDGRATTFVNASGTHVDFWATWSAIGTPSAGHIHSAPVGVNGGIVVPFFMGALPDSITGLAGSVGGLDRSLVKNIARNPAAYYTNLHTADFPAGAVRGQLFQAGKDARPAAVKLAVVRGAQIYACTKQADGSFAFTQNNVSAILEQGVRHSFVTPTAGPPQWIARDGSAVTGKLVARNDNGAGNIPELLLSATQSGRTAGLFATTTEILRLNTVGGVAPAGSCDPQRQPTIAVPYQADYLFVG